MQGHRRIGALDAVQGSVRHGSRRLELTTISLNLDSEVELGRDRKCLTRMEDGKRHSGLLCPTGSRDSFIGGTTNFAGNQASDNTVWRRGSFCGLPAQGWLRGEA